MDTGTLEINYIINFITFISNLLALPMAVEIASLGSNYYLNLFWKWFRYLLNFYLFHKNFFFFFHFFFTMIHCNLFSEFYCLAIESYLICRHIYQYQSDQMSRLVKIPGIVIAASTIKSKAIRLAIQCRSCANVINNIQVKPGLEGYALPRKCNTYVSK